MKISEAKIAGIHFFLMIVAIVLFSNKELEAPLFLKQLAISFVCGTFLFFLIWFKVCGEDSFEKFFVVIMYLAAASPLLLTYSYKDLTQWLAVGTGYFFAVIMTFFSSAYFKNQKPH